VWVKVNTHKSYAGSVESLDILANTIILKAMMMILTKKMTGQADAQCIIITIKNSNPK
jgi:small nuclear ribonucleoprotein (snRNP)-like protein